EVLAMIDQRAAAERAALGHDAHFRRVQPDELDSAPIGDERNHVVAVGRLALEVERRRRVAVARAERPYGLLELVAREWKFAARLDDVDDAARRIEVEAEGARESGAVGGLVGGAGRAPDEARRGAVDAARAAGALIEQRQALNREALAHG